MTRIPDLQRGCNFRDFGGYETRDGRRVRWGRLYRSGAMHRMTDEDRAQVVARGVRLVCDLRRPDERRNQPNPDFGAAVTNLFWDDTQDTGLGRAMPDPAAMDRSLARKIMARHYAGMPERMAPHVQGMFRELAHGAGAPMILHCTAGKDRTGFSAALLLSVLGVPHATIIDDYLLTNVTVDLRARLLDDESGLGIPQGRRYMVEMPAEALEAVLAADASYLQAAFDAIDAAYGTLDTYLREVVGVDERMRDALTGSLLEPA